MPTIADQLLDVLRQFPVADEGRRKKLAELKVRFVKDGTRHQIADFHRGIGAWASYCGVPYEGDGYIENSHRGRVDCMLCITDADDARR